MTSQTGRIHVIVDDYTAKLLDKIISKNMASTYGDAVKVAASNLLGIPVKSKRQLDLERRLSDLQTMANAPASVTFDINDQGERVNERYVGKDGIETPVKPPEDF